MSDIIGFSSLLELFAAINFSLLAVHIASHNRNKGFHSIMLDWVSHFFVELDVLFVENSIQMAYSDGFRRNLSKKHQQFKNCKSYIEKTQGFTMSCLFSGINCTCMLVLIGFHQINSDSEIIQSLFFTSNITTLCLLILLLINDILPVSKFKIKRHTVRINTALIPYPILGIIIYFISTSFNFNKVSIWIPVLITISPLLLYLIRFLSGYIYTKFIFKFFMLKNRSALNCLDNDDFSNTISDLKNHN